MNKDLPTPVPASAIFKVLGGSPPLVILLKSLSQMVFFLLCDDRNYILIQNLLDNHDQQNYQKILQVPLSKFWNGIW